MNADHDDETRRINGPALRTLHALERTLRRHIDALMKIGCEDAEAAEAIVFAIEAAEQALEKARDARRRILRGD
ncbi:MAG: hypothetical protein KatS3mg114_0480 [Planctomycetaceae bacterium]|nr:MAG: hypothetical protein KatS3mg114_0480 [Planctomycetaceae bacterium]